MPAYSLPESISTYIHTTADVTHLQDGIERFLDSLYRAETKSPVELMDEFFPKTISETLQQALKDSGAETKNTQEVKRLVTHLRDTLQQMKTISLTLAFDPPQKTVEKLSTWIKNAFGKNYVLEISTTPGVLGGAVIIVNGRYFDFSLKKKLDILFQVNKTEIETMLGNENSKSQSG